MKKVLTVIVAVLVLALGYVAVVYLKQRASRSATAQPSAATTVQAKINPADYSKLYKNLDDALKNSEKVYNLNLFNSSATQISADIFKLVNLTYLNLAVNNISSVPPRIGQLKNLEILYLGNNQLTSIPSEIGNLQNLTLLSLFQNKLTSLPPEIANLKKLTFLGLTGNPISKDEQTKIKSWLPKTDIKF